MKPWTFLDKLVWRIARFTTKFAVGPLKRIGITANQLTVLNSIIFIPLAVLCFAQGTYRFSLVGLIFLIVHTYFDFTDGALARANGKASKVGAWLDKQLDIISAEAILLGISVGVIRSNPFSIWLIVAFLAIFGRLGILSIVFEYDKTIYKSQCQSFLTAFRNNHSVNFFDYLIKELITLYSPFFLYLGTFRYLLFFAVIFDKLPLFLIITMVFSNIRWVVMFWAYASAISEKESSFEVIKLIKKNLHEENSLF